MIADSRGSADWYERLYAEARDESKVVPWDHGEPTPYVVTWLSERFPPRRQPSLSRSRAVVVGCAYGDDAELLAAYGFDVVAFDVSQTAVEAARSRHPESAVDYRRADLLDLPADWHAAFDVVIECTTLQAMPPALHLAGAAGVASLCAVGGKALVVARCPGDDDPPGPPWLLHESEVRDIATDGVRLTRLRRLPMRGGDRWVGEFEREPVQSN